MPVYWRESERKGDRGRVKRERQEGKMRREQKGERKKGRSRRGWQERGKQDSRGSSAELWLLGSVLALLVNTSLISMPSLGVNVTESARGKQLPY